MSARVFLPGSRVGVMGGGQLGRMFAIAARRMGYRVLAFTPDAGSPTGQLADVEIVAPYGDEEAVEKFARGVDVLTFEFENIPFATIELCAKFCVVRPSGEILRITQHRLREKNFLTGAGLPLAPFAQVDTEEDLRQAAARVGLPAVLKCAAFGYDGKGQRRLESVDGAGDAWRALGGEQAVLEKFIRHTKELSVIVARGCNGEVRTWPVCENVHRHHVLDVTMVPADIPASVEARARELAVAVAEALDLVGVLAVEMFLQEDGEILINELAPRPHNSGHFSFDASVTSQFEQQLRAVCGLPLGSTESLRPAAMANLLGDLWERGEPDWAAAAAFPEVKIHLYGKAVPRPGRKMGHLLALGNDIASARRAVEEARRCLGFHSS